MVDCDVLLAAKENIQPLAKGRRATALSAVFSTPLLRRDMHLARQREMHKQQVKAALSVADPLKLLDTYDQFVNWTIESYPQGDSAESGIVELLEEATRLLKERYSPDIYQIETYLRLWLLYADYVERPLVVYGFLMANNIGTDYSTFYECYADDLERSKRCVIQSMTILLYLTRLFRFKEADEIYNLGIARKATPITRLETRYRSFKRRMLTSNNPGSNLAAERTSSSSRAMPSAQRKKILGVSGQSASDSGQVLPLGNTAPLKPKPKANSCFVFSDETGSGEESSTLSPWADIGTKQYRKKENTREVTKAGDGVPLQSQKSRRVVSAPIRNTFVPFNDEESGDAVIEGLPAHSDGPLGLIPNSPNRHEVTGLQDLEDDSMNSLLRAKAQHQLTESEALKKDPLKNYQKP